MKTKGIILKSFIILLLLIANNYLAAQTVTQVDDLNLTENLSITLINIATSTLGKEESGLCKYIDGSLIPKISKFIVHISAEKSQSLPNYHRFSGAQDGKMFYKVELPCNAETYEKEKFEYPYVAIIYIWEETQRPFSLICGTSGIGSTIF